MKKVRRIAIIALVLVAQLFVVMDLAFRPVNLTRIPYRSAERGAALMRWHKNPSPENKAAYDEELRLASHHTTIHAFWMAGFYFSVLLIVEAFALYAPVEKAAGDCRTPRR